MLRKIIMFRVSYLLLLLIDFKSLPSILHFLYIFDVEDLIDLVPVIVTDILLNAVTIHLLVNENNPNEKGSLILIPYFPLLLQTGVLLFHELL